MATLRSDRTRQSRELILDAAIELFAENSYRATSLLDIEARSGVSRGSIPWHFGTKEGLLKSVVERLREGQEQRFAVDVPPGAEGAADLASRAALAIQGPRGRALLTLLFEATDPDSPIHDSFAVYHSTARQFYRRWLERPEVAAGLPPGVELDELSAALFGAVMGINQQWNLNREAFDLAGAHLTLFKALFPFLDWDDKEEPRPSKDGHA